MLQASYKSLNENFDNFNNDIKIIYHHNKLHEESYDKFFNENPFLKTNLIYREKNYLTNNLKILRPLNLLWIARWPKMFLEFNTFKYLLEDVIKNMKNDFVMFVPDDQIFYKKTKIPKKALQLISEKIKIVCITGFLLEIILLENTPYLLN